MKIHWKEAASNENEAFIDTLKEVPKKESWIGRLIGMGTENAARLLGVWRSPVVKGQCMSAYDTFGLCAFLMVATAMNPELITEMLNGLYGTEWSPVMWRRPEKT